MDPRDIKMQDYRYHLPPEAIASHPLAERDASRLLIYQDGLISEDIYRHLTAYLTAESLLVFNNSKVFAARIVFQKPSGGHVELFCLEPHGSYGQVGLALVQKEKLWWNCMIGGASKWKKGQLLEKITGEPGSLLRLSAKYIGREKDYFIVEFAWQPGQLPFASVLQQAGSVPLPPYIKRKVEAADKERYQTIYADKEGSVAAPTAGLHFSNSLMQQIKEASIGQAFLALHVGAGTFKPVSAETLGGHQMHAEWIEIPTETIRMLLQANGKPIIAVGTTSLRTMESLYWLGLQIHHQPDLPAHKLHLGQWAGFEHDNGRLPVVQSLQAVLRWLDRHQLDRLTATTELIIAPGYPFKISTALITNFHQPQSTLLLLIAAMIGEDWKSVYQHALDHRFRFLSYGDGCLLFWPGRGRQAG